MGIIQGVADFHLRQCDRVIVDILGQIEGDGDEEERSVEATGRAAFGHMGCNAAAVAVMPHRPLHVATPSQVLRSGAQAVAFGQGLVALLPQLSALTQILPPPTLEWKLQLLEEGNRCGM